MKLPLQRACSDSIRQANLPILAVSDSAQITPEIHGSPDRDTYDPKTVVNVKNELRMKLPVKRNTPLIDYIINESLLDLINQ